MAHGSRRVAPLTGAEFAKLGAYLHEGLSYGRRYPRAPDSGDPLAIYRRADMSAIPLLLCDAHHLAFRSYYGFPARITSRDKQRDLTCVFGFFALLRAGIRDNLNGPAEVFAVFDGEDGAAKRKAVDPGYKANRPTATPEPVKALGDLKRGLDTCGIRWIEIGDEEADDVIATITARSAPRDVVIMSGDKDYYQLLSHRVRILNTARKPGQRLIGSEEVPDRYGVTASQ